MKRVCFFFLAILLSGGLSFADEKEDYYALSQSYQDGFYNLSLNATRAFLKKYPSSSYQEDVILIKGLSLYQLKKYPQAVETFQLLLNSELPRIKEEAHFYLAKLYLLANESKQAEKHLLFLIQNSTNSKMLLRAEYELGMLYFRKGDYLSAIGSWEKVLSRGEEAESFRTELIHNLIISYFKSNKIESAEEVMKRYLKAEEADYHYFNAQLDLYRKRYPESLKKFQQISSSDYPDLWKEKAKLGQVWALIGLEEYAQAEQILEEMEKVGFPEIEEEAYYLKPYLFYKRGDFSPAVRYYQRFISKFKESHWLASAYLELVDSYYNIGRLEQAERFAQEFLKSFPESPNLDQMHYLLGWVYYKAGKMKRAIQEFEWVAQKSNHLDLKINSLCRVGDLLSEMDRFDQAIEQYNFVLRNYPDSLYAEYAQYQLGIDLLQKEDYDASIIALRTLLKNFPKSSLLDKVHYHLAIAYFKKSEYELALDEVNTLLDSFPDSELRQDALVKKAVLLYNLARYQEAIDLIQNTPSIQNEPYMHFVLAKAYLKGEKYQLAEREYAWLKENLKRAELLSYLYLQIGELKFYLKDWDQAEINFQNAYQLAQEEEVKEQALYWQAWCYYNKNEFNKALAIFERLKASSSLKEEARYYSALVLKTLGNYQEAAEELDQLLDSKSPFARLAALKLGDLYRERKEYQKALEYYKSLEVAPYDLISSEASFRIAEIYEIKQELDLALLQYLKLASLYSSGNPFVSKARIRSARILEVEGKIEEAVRIYRELSGGKGEEAIYAQERLKQLESSE